MEHAGTFARCPRCDGLGRILVVDRLGTTAVLDNNPGGTLTLSGFAGSSNLFVNSFTSIDNDLNEPGTKLLVDGVQVAQSTPLGDGAVETVTATLTPTITDNIKFVIGTVTKNDGNASRGVDNIEICTRPTPLGCTRTIGYWKTHAGFGPQADGLSAHLPIWLGTPGGASSFR